MTPITPRIVFFALMTLFPLEGQEGRLEGWRSFSLPGLPSEEQYILKALLDSRDSSVALTALAELKGGWKVVEYRPKVKNISISSVSLFQLPESDLTRTLEVSREFLLPIPDPFLS